MYSLFNLLQKNAAQLKPYLEKNKIEAYRLYYLDDRRWPIAVDIYQNNAVIHYFGALSEAAKQEIETSLKKLLPIEAIFIKDRTKEKSPPAPKQSKEIIVTEYGHKFLINLSDYLDTGLFLDHRESRKWIGEQSKGKTVLNTFAYTASFSVYAAQAGAAMTYSVDLSKTYCDWIKRNFELNGMPPEKNWVYKMDTLEFFRYAKRKNLRFDIIIIDPPTFSKNKGTNFSVQKDHPKLINEALELLTPNGFIFFSNNYRDFKPEREKIQSQNILEKRNTIPPDFRTGKFTPGIHRSFIVKP